MSKLYAAHYGGALTLASAGGGAVATLELPTDGDRPEALPAAPMKASAKGVEAAAPRVAGDVPLEPGSREPTSAVEETKTIGLVC